MVLEYWAVPISKIPAVISTSAVQVPGEITLVTKSRKVNTFEDCDDVVHPRVTERLLEAHHVGRGTKLRVRPSRAAEGRNGTMHDLSVLPKDRRWHDIELLDVAENGGDKHVKNRYLSLHVPFVDDRGEAACSLNCFRGRESKDVIDLDVPPEQNT